MTAPALVKGLPDVTVVGAGAFGAWTALCLRERGARVTLLDSYGPGNARQTTGDETRQIRAAYADKEIYTRWAMKAFERWDERQAEFGRRLLFVNGVVSPNEPEAQFEAEKAIFTRLNIPFETLSAEELRARWPQGRYDDVRHAFYEPKAGTIKARESVIAAAEALTRKGGTVRLGRAGLGSAAGGRLSDLALGDDTRLSTGMAIFACGPWLPAVLPEVMGGKIRRTRSEVFYIGSPAGDPRYHQERFPDMWEEGAAYSMSDVDYGYKIVPSFGTGVPIDPDRDERMASVFQLEKALRYVDLRVPGLRGQPVVASRVCALENSSNGDYIIDKHPAYDNVWIAGGGSGHGAKMGPHTGEYIADRVLGIADPEEERALFALSAHRAVAGD